MIYPTTFWRISLWAAIVLFYYSCVTIEERDLFVHKEQERYSNLTQIKTPGKPPRWSPGPEILIDGTILGDSLILLYGARIVAISLNTKNYITEEYLYPCNTILNREDNLFAKTTYGLYLNLGDCGFFELVLTKENSIKFEAGFPSRFQKLKEKYFYNLPQDYVNNMKHSNRYIIFSLQSNEYLIYDTMTQELREIELFSHFFFLTKKKTYIF